MKWSEKAAAVIQAAGCGTEIETLDRVMENLQAGRTKQVGVLGEISSGKTTLINRMAEKEVRKPSRIAREEPPLMVTFGSGEVKEGYEVIDVKNPRCEEIPVSFFEIPADRAIHPQTLETEPMLEEMDAVIYVLSALTPFTASDAARLGAMVNRFPMVIYVSKAEQLASREEYEETLAYIKRQFSESFDGMACEILDSTQPDAVDAILEGLKDLAVRELREIHRDRLLQREKDIVEAGLRRQLEQLEREKKEREANRVAADASYRKELLEWEELRLEMRERKQEAITLANRQIAVSRGAVKERMTMRMNAAGDKRVWIREDLKNALQKELKEISHTLEEDLARRARADEAWLTDEVEKRWGITSYPEARREYHRDWRTKGPSGIAEKPDKSKLAAAAGSGLIAGGALFGSMSLIPTCMVATPAVLAMIHLIRKSREEEKEYDEKLEQAVKDCCDRNFTAFTGQMHTVVDCYYENMAEHIRNLSGRQKTAPDPNDLDARKEKIFAMLEELARQIG